MKIFMSKTINIVLILVGVIIFTTSFIGGGLLFHIPIPFYTQLAWFIGVTFVAIGLWLNEKDKKVK